MAEYANVKTNRTTARQRRNERPPDANTVKPEVTMDALKRGCTEDGRPPGVRGGSKGKEY